MPGNMRRVAAGQRFGRGTVTTPDAGRDYHNAVQVRLLCDCGTEYLALRARLWRGVVKSCGCLSRQNLAEGRSRGASHHSAKLTEADVREIRRLYRSTAHLRHRDPARWSYPRLAAKFGVHVNTVKRAGRRATWRHVTETGCTPREA
jgi:hypothetical protein